ERGDHGLEMRLDGTEGGGIAALGRGGERVHGAGEVIGADLRAGGGGPLDHAPRIGEQVQAAVSPAAAALVGEARGQVPDLPRLGAAAAVDAAVGAHRGARAVAEVEVEHRLLGGEV